VVDDDADEDYGQLSKKESKQQVIIQFSWDPSGSELLHRLGGKPKPGGPKPTQARQSRLGYKKGRLRPECVIKQIIKYQITFYLYELLFFFLRPISLFPLLIPDLPLPEYLYPCYFIRVIG
jgi:hypothetical protein